MVDISNKNYYELLGVRRNASLEEVKDAYKDIARIYHPDSTFYSEIIKVQLTEEDAEVFRIITAAYNVLSHPDKRTRYDRSLPPAEEDDGINFGEYTRKFDYEWKELAPNAIKNGQPKKKEVASGSFGTFGDVRANIDPQGPAVSSGSRNMSIHEMISERRRRVRNRFMVITFGLSLIIGIVIALVFVLR